MLHTDRVWCLYEVETASDLATMLTESSWCCCQAFQVIGHPDYMFLNDSTSPDRIQEYAVIKCEAPAGFKQIESITFGWCDQEKALRYIEATLRGDDDHNPWAHFVSVSVESQQQHGRCQHCA